MAAYETDRDPRARQPAPAPVPARSTPAARLWMRLLSLLVAALLFAVGALSYRMYRLENYMLPRNQPSLGVPRPDTPREGLSGSEQARIALFGKTWQSIVHITNIALQTDPFRMNVLEVPKGTGSGVVWDV